VQKRFFDVFNGDADGLCALHQLRLAQPLDAELITGAKRDIELLARADARTGDCVTVCDISLDRNRDALMSLLHRGGQIVWFDHHYAGEIPVHPLLQPHIDPSPGVCTSMLVDRHLGGKFRAWAVVAAFGDGLPEAAHALADSIVLEAGDRAALRELGEDLNYNAYGESEADLLIHPAALYFELKPFADPLMLVRQSTLVGKIRVARSTDMEAARAVTAYRQCACGDIYLLPDATWSRRVSGTLANHLAASEPQRAHAVLAPDRHGGYIVSIRAPRATLSGASRLARAFASGSGREAAAGIDHLPAGGLERFIEQFAGAW
jgi:hypothetical protein